MSSVRKPALDRGGAQAAGPERSGWLSRLLGGAKGGTEPEPEPEPGPEPEPELEPEPERQRRAPPEPEPEPEPEQVAELEPEPEPEPRAEATPTAAARSRLHGRSASLAANVTRSTLRDRWEWVVFSRKCRITPVLYRLWPYERLPDAWPSCSVRLRRRLRRQTAPGAPKRLPYAL